MRIDNRDNCKTREGAKAKEIEIAKNLLNICTPKEDIIKVTGLGIEELEDLTD